MLQKKPAKAALWVMAAVFLLLRFVHLSADYPHWMRWDDGIATDEGWYASSAINHQLWHRWHLPGDMNIPVLMPVWSGIVSVAFRLGGFGIVSARAAAAVMFLGCVAVLLPLLRRYGGKEWTALYAAMLACNPWAFTFSRSAFLEFPMLFFFLLAVWFAGMPGRDDAEDAWTPRWQALLAGCVFAAAMLTKTVAVPLVLPLLYVVAHRHPFRWPQALRDAVGMLACSCLVYGTVWMLLARRYMQDVRFYLSVVQSGFHWTAYGVIADSTRPFRYGLGSDHLLFALTVAVLIASVFSRRVRSLWREPLFALPAIWFVAFLAFMAEHNNDPARYFAVVIPAVLLIGIALLRHLRHANISLYRVLLLIVLVDGVVNVAQVCLFLAKPAYTFCDASLAIRHIVEADPGGNRVMLGDNMHEVALQSGLKPMNLLFHGDSITQQVQRYQPGWWVQFQPQDQGDCFREVLSAGYTAERMGSWQVFYPGTDLTLWKLQRTGGTLPETLTAQQQSVCLPPPAK